MAAAGAGECESPRRGRARGSNDVASASRRCELGMCLSGIRSNGCRKPSPELTEGDGSGSDRRRNHPASGDDAGRRPNRGPGDRDSSAPPMDVFKRGRHFAAWLGLSPWQHFDLGRQTGSRGRSRRWASAIFVAGLIICAMTVVCSALRKGAPGGKLATVHALARKTKMLGVVITLANKMARLVWAMLAKGGEISPSSCGSRRRSERVLGRRSLGNVGRVKEVNEMVGNQMIGYILGPGNATSAR